MDAYDIYKQKVTDLAMGYVNDNLDDGLYDQGTDWDDVYDDVADWLCDATYDVDDTTRLSFLLEYGARMVDDLGFDRDGWDHLHDWAKRTYLDRTIAGWMWPFVAPDVEACYWI